MCDNLSWLMIGSIFFVIFSLRDSRTLKIDDHIQRTSSRWVPDGSPCLIDLLNPAVNHRGYGDITLRNESLLRSTFIRPKRNEGMNRQFLRCPVLIPAALGSMSDTLGAKLLRMMLRAWMCVRCWALSTAASAIVLKYFDSNDYKCSHIFTVLKYAREEPKKTLIV